MIHPNDPFGKVMIENLEVRYMKLIKILGKRMLPIRNPWLSWWGNLKIKDVRSGIYISWMLQYEWSVLQKVRSEWKK